MSVALTSISLSACATGEKKNISTAKPNIHFDDFAKLSLVDIMHWSVRGFDFLPPGNQRAIDRCLCPWGGEFEPEVSSRSSGVMEVFT